MPRPANPGWRPKTVTLSLEVIEAVWVKAAREGKTPGRVINEVLAAVLLSAPVEAEQSSTQPPAQSLPGAVEISASQPSSHCEPAPAVTDKDTSDPRESPSVIPAHSVAGEDVATEPPSSIETQQESADLEQAELIRMLQDPHRYRLGTRSAFFQELSERCGEKISMYEFHRWREQASIPAHLLPHVWALIEEKRHPKGFKRV